MGSVLNRILLVLALALTVLAPGVASASGPAAVRKQMEASMLVTGAVVIERDGRVSAWELDRPDRLPKAVTDLVAKSAAAWRFDPVMVDGDVVRAKARMSLRVVATPHDDDSFEVTIRSGHFGYDALGAGERDTAADTDSVAAVRMQPPTYPKKALDANRRGTVSLVLRSGREGRVTDAFAEQVNLRVVAAEGQMERMRQTLIRPALVAARKWTFEIPTTGDEADDDHWLVRVPVEYQISGEKEAGYGEWQAYVPGPRQTAPWSADAPGHGQSPDALVAGRIYQEGRELTLLTPLGEG